MGLIISRAAPGGHRFFLALVLVGCACATTGGPDNPQASADAPSWMRRGGGAFLCHGQEVLRAVGDANLGNEAFASRAAEKNAREALSNLVRSWVTHLTQTHQGKKHEGDKLVGITSVITWVTEEAMRQARIVGHYREGQTTTALAELPADAAIATWKDLNWPDSWRPFVLEDSRRSFHEKGRPPEVCDAE